jgi:DNA-binding NtrC family response regulator
MADDALAALESHSWPGNIRELENVLERTILFCKSDRIERADLQLASTGPVPVPEPPRTTTNDSQPLAPIPEDDDDETGETSGSLKDAVRAKTAQVERDLIVKALDETGGNVTQAARLLKISRKSLQMKMKEFGLRDKEG